MLYVLSYCFSSPYNDYYCIDGDVDSGFTFSSINHFFWLSCVPDYQN
jgi:hypothetical protein